MSGYESIEPQFDLAAQEARVDAARKARVTESLAKMSDALEVQAKQALEEESTLGQAILQTSELLEAAATLEVPEVPGRVEQEPELPGTDG